MKISNEPTPYLLLKAGTDSAWDCCDFAIVYLSKEWRQTQSGRLEAVKPFKDDISFQSLNFYDISVGFYQPDEDGILGSEDLPEDNNWCFVELTETERKGWFRRTMCWSAISWRYLQTGKPDTGRTANIPTSDSGLKNSLCNRFWIYWRVMNLKISKQL